MSFLQPEGQPVSAAAAGGSHQSQSCADEVAAMKVPELKAKLAEFGLPTSGKKAALQKRLQEVMEEESGDMEVEKPPGPAGPPSAVDPLQMNVADLKAALHARGCSKSGNKGTLQTRLIAALAEAEANPPPSPGKLAGLTLAEKKPKDAAAASAAAPPPPRKVPEQGSPILEVHPNYHQVGNRHSTKVVIADDGVTVYNAHFSQVDTASDTNRYYVVQLLRPTHGGYQVFCTHGRTLAKEESRGMHGRINKNYQLYSYSTLKEAVASFEQWFHKKCNWSWSDRHNFRKTPLSYTFLEQSTTAPQAAVEASQAGTGQPARAHKPSALDPALRGLVEMLFDADTAINAMSNQGVEVSRDFSLGSLTPERVAKGRALLAQLRSLLEERPPQPLGDDMAGLTTLHVWEAKVASASNNFFETIPNKDPSKISGLSMVEQYERTLDVLDDIAATSQLRESAKELTEIEEHPIDKQYAQLKCEMIRLDHEDPTFKAIVKAAANTAVPLCDSHGNPHAMLCGFHSTRAGGPPPRVAEVYDLTRLGEAERHARFAGVGNRKLLWHGTDVAVAAAIVSSGLRIMPGAGGRVGRGIYLADEMNKSGFYCRPNRTDDGIIFLAEAALGRQYVVPTDSHSASSLRSAPPGYDSVRTASLSVPDPAGNVDLTLDGQSVTLATGAPCSTAKPGSGNAVPAFIQREYLVYDEAQIRLRYLVQLEM